jgi:hypothetical protein
MDPLGIAPWFEGTGFQRWKVLMQDFLQAQSLNVWRVVSEGMKNDGHQERQYDIIAKSIILSSLYDNMCNRVFACKNSIELWKTINENHDGTKDVAIKDIMFSLISLIALSNLIMKMLYQYTHD